MKFEGSVAWSVGVTARSRRKNMVTWIRAGLLIYLCQFLAPISSGSDEAKLHEGKTREKRGAVYPVGTVLQV